LKPGPKPKPTELKKLAGNPGKRPLNDAEPQFPVPSRTPSPPDHLGNRAQEVWRELGKMLLDAGLFTQVDQYALGMFCAAAGRWMEAETLLQEAGPVLISDETGNLYQNPYLHVANRAWGQMRQMFGEFGLSPAERARLKVPGGGDEKEPSLAEQLFQMVKVEDD
jgi:P27 family predicted phage terminase small subunit